MSLEVKQLQAMRGDQVLFEDVTFSLEPGQALRVLGQNGSGKTTLLRALCGLFRSEKGEILWQGENIQTQRDQFHQDLLYIGHQNSIKADLTVYENLALQTQLAGQKPDSRELLAALKALGIHTKLDAYCRNLSQGQKRRVALARLVISQSMEQQARLWILDEPFVALDVAAVQYLVELIQQHLQQGGMLVMTTHQDVALAADTLHTLDLDALKAEKEEAVA